MSSSAAYRSTVLIISVGLASIALAAEMPTGKEYTNSIGMKFVRIEPGTFQMGVGKTPLPPQILPEFRGRGLCDNLRDGDYDEQPVHTVEITKSFYIGIFEVTNFQYELFDPRHKELRGKNGFSKDDDEAVVYVSWYDAEAFCQWLSDKEGLPCRLPTEAEWEYACRAGTTTHYYHGDIPPQGFGRDTSQNALTVGKTIPNAWGLYDMHGNVEEWCHDWYGPYTTDNQVDPVGCVTGDFRVLRGGSHSTDVYYLRSANRMGALPDDKHWLIGFRVVLGELPLPQLLPSPSPELNQQNVVQRDATRAARGPDPDKPYFKGPRRYVNIPTQANGPVYAAHNHDPAIVGCPNGDLLAVWYTCVSEKGRELAQAASRLRWGAEKWQPASLFWDAPDRNDHAPALWFDGKKTIYHFTGMSFAAGHHRTSVVMRTSTNSGATWSAARIIIPDYFVGKKPSGPVFRMNDGAVAFAVDHSGPWGNGSDLWISRDETLTWSNPGGHISGIHAGVAQLNDGRLIGFGREGEFAADKGKRALTVVPMSISADGGKTFTWHETNFPGIGGQQRLALLKLREGPLVLFSFANTGIEITDVTGARRTVRGLYAALSKDGGKTWPHIRLISDDQPGRAVESTGGGLFILSNRNSEYRGYLSACQSADGLIHLISSRQHYTFNLKWLETAAPPETSQPVKVKPVIETFDGPDRFDADGWADYHSYLGAFNGTGQFTLESLTHHNGINRVVGKGSFEATINVKSIRYYPRTDRVSEGLSIWIKDDRARMLALSLKEDSIKLEVRDTQPATPMPGARYRGDRGWILENQQVSLSSVPTSAGIKFIWNEPNRQWRIYYSLDPYSPPDIELPQSKAGLYFGKPLTESTTIYILMSNGRIDIDHFEITPIDS